MTVLHALPEHEEHRRDFHLRYWYGTVQPDANEELNEDSPVVCWCGGRRHWLDKEVSVVWHVRPWHEGPHDQDPLVDE